MGRTVLALLLGALFHGTALGAPTLRVEHTKLGAPVYQVRPLAWNGKPALMVLTRQEGETPARALLHLLQSEKSHLRLVSSWPVPSGTIHLEPVRLAGGGIAFLSWAEGRWSLLTPEGSSLKSVALCPCPDSAAVSRPPDPFQARLAADVDGDGVDEVLLPQKDFLSVLTLNKPSAPVERWRIDWNESRQPLSLDEQGKFQIPELFLVDVNGDGHPEVLMAGPTGFQVAELHGVAAAAGTATPVRAYGVPFQGVEPDGPKDRTFLLGLQDMDGDGVMDALHARLLNTGNVFKQENRMRWYRGELQSGKLRLGPPDRTFKTDAGTLALLLHPRTQSRPPLALMMAFAEVNLSSVMKALASESVTLDVRVFAFSRGTLNSAPETEGQFTYQQLRKPGRRAMFLAADLDGEGTRDFLLNTEPETLTVFLGHNGKTALSGPPAFAAPVPLPSHPKFITITDLDGTGREVLVISYQEKYHGADAAGALAVVRLKE